MKNYKTIILGPQCSGKTTLIKYLRAQDPILPITEEDELFTKLNGGEYPQDIEYKENVLRAKLESEISKAESIIFVSSYCNPELLKKFKSLGYKVIQLILDQDEFEKRNQKRMAEDGYADARTWMKEIFKFHEDIRKEGLVDKEINVNQPIEAIAKEVLDDLQDGLKVKIQECLGKEIIKFTLKGRGAVNYAYYIETGDGKKYIVKQERDDKEFQPQNDLVMEAKVVRQLNSLSLSVPIPSVVFVSENPEMYGYEYVEGDLLRGVWKDLSESEKIDICRNLGKFHAEIGKRFTKEMAEEVGIKIDMSSDVHPEVSADYDRLILDTKVPEDFKTLVREARSIFDRTQDKLVFQFLHNDSHHENIIIKDKAISGIIDFGNAEYGETAKEFSRYIRDFPDHFQHIVSSYEEVSGNKLSYERLLSNALISGFIDIVEDYWKEGVSREKAEIAIHKYKELLTK